MAARKLAAEIDRTLKKVSEGVEQFESLYDKMQTSQNQTQKEKMESDLKTQIKKLQRLRDQIKTWQQSNDVKDKKALTDSRRSIEMQMERFKATEKEMKTKAFSKEGLIAAARLDPAEKAKVEMCSWLSSQVDELGRQIETTEAEVEQMQVGAGKKKKSASVGASMERTANLEYLNERRSWHQSRLEILHRMIENGSMEPDRVGEVKEDISYFVESNADEEFEEDEGIYDEFELENQEENFGLKGEDDVASSHDDVSVIEETPPPQPQPPSGPKSTAVKETPKRRESESESKKEGEGSSKRTGSMSSGVAGVAGRKASESGPSRIQTSDAKQPPVPPANFAAAKQPATSPSTQITSPTKPTAPTSLPPIRYAAAAAAAVGSGASSSAAPGGPTSGSSTLSSAVSTDAPPSAITTEPSSVAASHTADVAQEAAPAAPPGLARTQSPAINGVSEKPSPSLTHSSLRQGSVVHDSPSSEHPSAARASTSAADGSSSQSPSVSSAQHAPFQAASLAGASAAANTVQPSGGSAAATSGQKSTSDPRLPQSLADLVTSFESAKMRSMNRDGEENMASLHKSLDSSFMNVPEPLDSEKPKYYVPKTPYNTSPYYPTVPAAIFDNPSIYSKFDEDTLFYIFYYQQGTYHQHLAARELKKQSWRFHKQFLTWFRRHSEPQAITDEYEQGVYVYFDWEGSWAQRKKSDFRFEYRWLED
ncbi:unnamed protein product [Parajaminaea phylloscopi]